MPGRYNWRVWAAGVAQLVEHLICNQRVGGSNPFASSSLSAGRCGRDYRRDLARKTGERVSKSLFSTDYRAGSEVSPQFAAASNLLGQQH